MISRAWGLKCPTKISVTSRSEDSGYSVIGYTEKLLLNFPDFLDSATWRPNFDSEQEETLLLPWKGRAHLCVLQHATQIMGRLNSHWSCCMTHTLPSFRLILWFIPHQLVEKALYTISHLLHIHTGWQVRSVKTSRWLTFGMFRHPVWAVGSYSSGPLAASTVVTKSTGGFYRPDLSPCTCTFKNSKWQTQKKLIRPRR